MLRPERLGSRVRGERSWLQPHPVRLTTPVSLERPTLRAEPSPGLDCADRTLLQQPRLPGLASPPTRRRAVMCAREGEGGRKCEQAKGRGDLLPCGCRWSFGLSRLPGFLSLQFPSPGRAPGRSQRGRLQEKPSPGLPTPTAALAKGGKKEEKGKKSQTALLSPAKSEKINKNRLSEERVTRKSFSIDFLKWKSFKESANLSISDYCMGR